MQNKMEYMKSLVEKLNEAGKAYYQEDREIMSNFEYDALYDELLGWKKNLAQCFQTARRCTWAMRCLASFRKRRMSRRCSL